MFSTTDTSLPFGQPEQGYRNNYSSSRRKITSWSEGQMDIYAIRQRVIRAYRNEVVNRQPLSLNN